MTAQGTTMNAQATHKILSTNGLHLPFVESQLEPWEKAQSLSRGLTMKLEQFLLTRPETPFLAMDLDVVEAKYRELRSCFLGASVYYAMKANPAKEIVTLLAGPGSNFDVASRGQPGIDRDCVVTRGRSLVFGSVIMNRTERKKIIPVIHSLRITHTADAVSTATQMQPDIAVCSPRGNVAYSFWLSWRWLKSKIVNKNSKRPL